MSTGNLSIEEHPDIVELRQRYDRVGSTGMAQIVDGVTLMAGLYVAMSPWIIGFSATHDLMVNDLITGLAVALLALGFASAFSRTHGVAWTSPLLGVWVIVAPFVIAGVTTTTGIILSNVISGAVIVLLGLFAAGMPQMRTRGARRNHMLPDMMH